MVSLINSWIKGIIIAVIITIIIEMILPEGKNKKYIKTVIAIYIVYVIISPIFSKFMNKTIDINKILENYKITEVQVDSIDNSKYIETTFKENIKENITSNLSNMGYQIKKIDIFINTKEEKYGQIEKITLLLNKNYKKSVSKIETVDINSNKKEEIKEIQEEDRQKISEYLINNYGVSENNIIIGVDS